LWGSPEGWYSEMTSNLDTLLPPQAVPEFGGDQPTGQRPDVRQHAKHFAAGKILK